jgi:hypothetical protein
LINTIFFYFLMSVIFFYSSKIIFTL